MLAVKRKDIKRGRNWVGAGRGPAAGAWPRDTPQGWLGERRSGWERLTAPRDVRCTFLRTPAGDRSVAALSYQTIACSTAVST